MDLAKIKSILFFLTLLFSSGNFTSITEEELENFLQNFKEKLFQEWENKLAESSLKQDVEIIKMGRTD